jgi:glutathione peroxidase
MSRFVAPAAAVLLLGVAALAAGCGGARAAAPGPDPAVQAQIARQAEAIRAQAARAARVLPAARRGPAVLGGRIGGLDGRPIDLTALRGRVVLVVNTASRCGFTEQFTGLEALWRERRADGLVVVGVPTNDFRQEAPDDGEVARVCRLGYGVSFPMAARSRVSGPRPHPLFARLAARPGPAGGAPTWNFTKYLIDREGRLAARMAPHLAPGDPLVVQAVDRLLAERPARGA